MAVKASYKLDDVPFNEPVRVPTELLKLDSENPRLILSESDTRGDDAVITELNDEGELGELLQSISSNGYLDFEPLVVTQLKSDTKLTVLEGNRRLAALMLLTNAKLATKLGISVPKVEAEKSDTLKLIRVIRVKSREEARPFIAFKHINGPHRWDSYAKAKFAADWYAKEKAKGSKGLSLTDISERIGDNHDTIKRMVAGIYVLNQAAAKKIFSVEDRATGKFPFSHLYTALSRSEYMEFLGLGEGWSRYDPTVNPVPTKNLPKLKELLSWMYGSKEDATTPVIRSQNPDIKRLAVVLASASAVHVLREQRNLDKAFAQTTPPSEKLSSSLIQSRESLQEAVSSLKAFTGRDRSLFEICEDISELAAMLYSRMKEKLGKST